MRAWRRPDLVCRGWSPEGCVGRARNSHHGLLRLGGGGQQPGSPDFDITPSPLRGRPACRSRRQTLGQARLLPPERTSALGRVSLPRASRVLGPGGSRWW